MNDEQKLITVITLLPLMLDYCNDISDKFPKVITKSLKFALNNFIHEADKRGVLIMLEKTLQDQEQVEQQYQQMYEIWKKTIENLMQKQQEEY